MRIEPPVIERPKRFPFDRVGILALVWATLCVAAAAGLAIALS